MPTKQDLLRMRDGQVQHHLKVTKLDDDKFTASTTDNKIVGEGKDEIAAIRDAKLKIEQFYLEETNKLIF